MCVRTFSFIKIGDTHKSVLLVLPFAAFVPSLLSALSSEMGFWKSGGGNLAPPFSLQYV